MNEFFTQFKNRARAERLSPNEKQAMRVQLYNYFERNPASDFAAPALKPAKPVPSMYYFFSPRFAVPIAVLLVIGLGSGTAFAAQGALPGNPLYAIKVNVNEPVQVALATTPEARAQVNASIATTRLEEAETLAATDKLDATTTAELATNFAAHAQAAQSSAESLQSNDPGTAAQLNTDFSSTLAAHGAILAEIGDDSSSTETMQNSNSLAVQAEQEETHAGGNGGAVVAITSDVVPTMAPAATGTPANAARRTFAAVAPRATIATGSASSSTTTMPTSTKVKNEIISNSGNSNDAKIAASLAMQASTSIAVMVTDFATISPSLNATTSAQVSAQIDAVQNIYASATAELAAGSASGAVRDFISAVRTSVKLDAYLKAGKKFNWKLLSGLLTTGSSSVNLHL